jgi:predicted NBD/HSP70 family sugar kinase
VDPSLTVAASARVDQQDLRRQNLGVVLRWLRDRGPRSRASLAAEVGMTRSTVSTLVGELEDRGLVRIGSPQRGAIGRPGQAVEMDGRSICGIGAEVNVNHVSTLALDLGGRVVAEHKVSLDAHELTADEVLDQLAELVQQTVADLTAAEITPIGLTVGIAGLVDRVNDVLTYGPNLGWRDVEVGALIRSKLGDAIPVVIDNEGNLAAIAEATPGDPDRQDILVIFGEVGVGGGIVAGGRLLRGRQGYAGEFGHMIVEPGGRRCGCGQAGCWETVCGLGALLDLAADPDDIVRNPALELDERLAELNLRAARGDRRTVEAMEKVGSWVGVGAAMMTNALNPAAIVLSGYFAAVGHHMQPAIETELRAGVFAPDAGGTRVAFSELGFGAAVRGGALIALDAVFDDPTCVRPRQDQKGVKA